MNRKSCYKHYIFQSNGSPASAESNPAQFSQGSDLCWCLIILNLVTFTSPYAAAPAPKAASTETKQSAARDHLTKKREVFRWLKQVKFQLLGSWPPPLTSLHILLCLIHASSCSELDLCSQRSSHLKTQRSKCQQATLSEH